MRTVVPRPASRPAGTPCGLLLGGLLALAGVLGLAAAPPPARAEDQPFDERLRRALADVALPRPEAREDGLRRLGLLADEDPERARRAVPVLADVLRRRPPGEAAAAVLLLSRLPGEDARRHWLEALDPLAHPRVFLAALDGAAARSADAEASKALLARARDPRLPPSARALALEALGATGTPAARLALSRPLGAPDPAAPEDWLLAAGRARGLERYEARALTGGRASFEPLSALLAHPHAAARVAAWEALLAVTGRAFACDPGPWRAWWEREGAAAAGPAAPGEPALRPADGDRPTAPEGNPLHVPTFYGIPIDRPRSRVVFCLDVSQSMYGRGIDRARRELAATLADLPASYAFDVIAFNERAIPFAGEPWPAHPVVKERALAWFAALETTSYTALWDAVETAFGYGGIGERPVSRPTRLDAVFLLSDGAPNRGRYQQEEVVVEQVAALSRGRIPVHAIAAGERVFGLLRKIAAATGGRFVDAFE